MGSRRVRQGRVRPVLPGVDARTARLHQAGHRGRGPVDRLMRRPVVSERRTRARRVPHRQLDDRRARQRSGKRLWNQARRDGDEKTTKRMRGVKYAVLKNPGDLTDRQSEAFGNLRNTGPKGQLYRSWQLKELLRTLLKHPLEQARGELRHWVFRASHSRIPEIVELSKKKSGDAAPTSHAPSNRATPAPGSRPSTTGSRPPSAWPTASTTRTASSHSSCSAAPAIMAQATIATRRY